MSILWPLANRPFRPGNQNKMQVVHADIAGILRGQEYCAFDASLSSDRSVAEIRFADACESKIAASQFPLPRLSSHSPFTSSQSACGGLRPSLYPSQAVRMISSPAFKVNGSS